MLTMKGIRMSNSTSRNWEAGGDLILEAEYDPDYLVPNTSLSIWTPATSSCGGEDRRRITPHGTSNRVETVDLPIALVKDIALHEDYHAWAGERDAWIEVARYRVSEARPALWLVQPGARLHQRARCERATQLHPRLRRAGPGPDRYV